MNNGDITGIIAWRMWHLYALLESTHDSLSWPSDTWTYPMRSKGIPTASNNKGLYSFSINDLEPTHELLDEYLGGISVARPQNERAMGIIELRGRILAHTNGQFRSQWARPLIIWVDASIKDAHMGKLSQAYQCPVVATDDLLKSYDKWISDNQNLR